MKKSVILITIAFYANYSSAQIHYEDWNKISFLKKLNNKFSVLFDINIRQQSNYKANETNFFELPLVRSQRLWVMYNFTNNYSLIGSFLYGLNTDIANTKYDFITTNDMQYDIGIMKNATIKTTKLRSRFLVEYRTLNTNNISNAIQYRYRFQENATFLLKTFANKNSFNCVLNDEVFFKTQNSVTELDQNRLYATLQYHTTKVEYNIGYQKTYQNQSSKLVDRNQLVVNLFVML